MCEAATEADWNPCLSFRSDTRRWKWDEPRRGAWQKQQPLHFFTWAEADDPCIVSSYHFLLGTTLAPSM
jgi:hypothetical protein